jgi:hypothetical protein
LAKKGFQFQRNATLAFQDMSLKDSHRDAKWRGQGEGECMPDYTILFRIVGEQKMPRDQAPKNINKASTE